MAAADHLGGGRAGRHAGLSGVGVPVTRKVYRDFAGSPIMKRDRIPRNADEVWAGDQQYLFHKEAAEAEAAKALAVPQWRYFHWREIEEAVAWAKAGNVALHHTGMPFRQWAWTCHLFARDIGALKDAARAIGVQLRWIQYPDQADRVHYDVFGKPLERGLAICREHGGPIIKDPTE